MKENMHYEEPMDMAVAMWKIVHIEKYREAHLRILAIGEQWYQRQANELLKACENLDPSDIFDLVAEMPPSSYVIALLVTMAKKSQKKATAKTGGSKRAEKILLVKLFSIELFDAGNWRSTKQAKTKIWPEVKEKANILGWNMTDETGPETLYKWLLAHKKVQRLQVNA